MLHPQLVPLAAIGVCAFVAQGQRCEPHWSSGSLDLFDFLTFLNLFNADDPAADCDGSGALDLSDFLCFVDQFAQGCP